MELLFAYGAGLLTLINPCVLPVLPIVLASALSADRRGPLALAAGMSVSFVGFGMIVATIGHSIGLNETVLAQVGAMIMIMFGLLLLVPVLRSRFERATAGISTGADERMQSLNPAGMKGQFLGGLLLGAVWSPCIGPTLGGAIALASQGENLIWSMAIMVAFSLGVSTLIISLSFGTRETLCNRTQGLKGLAEKSKPLMGIVFSAVGLMILFEIHHIIEAWAVRNLPVWLQDLSVAL